MTRYETLAERLESQRHLSTVREHLLFRVARTVRTDVAVIEECYREMTGQRTENKSVGLEDMYRHLEHIRELTDSVLDGQIVGVGESVCDTFQISDVVAELTSECRTICTEMGIEVTVQEVRFSANIWWAMSRLQADLGKTAKESVYQRAGRDAGFYRLSGSKNGGRMSLNWNLPCRAALTEEKTIR